MRILLLAPHPFYQERGTPIAVDLLLRALSERGDRVDVVTYHEGVSRSYPGVEIHRASAPPGVRRVRPGLSFKKIVCDLFLAAAAFRLARTNRYDLVHAVEESVFIAMLLQRRRSLPYVFDMDSSMPRQIVDKKPAWRFLLPAMERCERAAIRRAVAVLAVCDSLDQLARSQGAVRSVVLRDISLLDPAEAAEARPLRRELGIRGACLLYLGNLESYQGIDLLLESFALVPAEKGAGLVIAGGNPADIEKHRRRAARLGTAASVHFIGPRPLSEMGALFAGADILVSPRIQGGNTPMKIYSYLGAGRAILATALPTHTQVLDARVAVLAEPDPRSFADGMLRLIEDEPLRARLGAAGRSLARDRYSMDVFRRTVRKVFADIEGSLQAAGT